PDLGDVEVAPEVLDLLLQDGGDLFRMEAHGCLYGTRCGRGVAVTAVSIGRGGGGVPGARARELGAEVGEAAADAAVGHRVADVEHGAADQRGPHVVDED